MGKANDPRPIRVLALPRCGSGRSGDDAANPVGPTNFVEGRRARTVGPADRLQLHPL